MNSRRIGLVMLVLSAIAFFVALGMRESIRIQQAEARAEESLENEDNSEGLPRLSKVTDFALIDSSGSELGLRDLEGKIWVADFMFTSCQGICPTLTTNMRSVQEAFENDPLVHFVSLSVDPETDTPGVLHDYAGKFDADLDTWHFLTGPVEEIQVLATEGFKIGYKDEPIYHSDRFVLVDPAGDVRGYFKGTEQTDLPDLIAAIQILKREFEL